MSEKPKHTGTPALRKRLWLTLGLCAAAIAVVVLMVCLALRPKATPERSGEETSSADAAVSSQSGSVAASTTASPAPSVSPAPSASAQPTAAPAASPTVAPSSDPVSGTVPPTTAPAPAGGASETAPQPQTITLPYSIPGSGLVVRTLSGYDGIYLEDGSDSEISNVAALVVENTGSSSVEYAEICIVQGGCELRFKLSALPAGATGVIQEASRLAPATGEIESCTADVATTEMGMAESQVQVADNGSDGLTVTNVSGADIPCVRIFYKYYMSDENAYVGGIAYTAKLTGLAAGQTITVTPSHYASGASRVVMVRTYDTAE